MAYVVIGIIVVLLLSSLLVAYVLWPAHGMHELHRGMEEERPDWLPPALPALLPDWQPRAVPDILQPAPDLTEALRATRHPMYQYAARLAAQSWQSHKTLQRNYDVMAFATVMQAYYRQGMSYA